MKQLIIALSIAFAQDFNATLPEIEYRIVPLDYHYGIAKKETGKWQVSLDEDWIRQLSRSRLKTLVYHELGHTIGLPDNTKKRDIMNPKHTWRRYQYFK